MGSGPLRPPQANVLRYEFFCQGLRHGEMRAAAASRAALQAFAEGAVQGFRVAQASPPGPPGRAHQPGPPG